MHQPVNGMSMKPEEVEWFRQQMSDFIDIIGDEVDGISISIKPSNSQETITVVECDDADIIGQFVISLLKIFETRAEEGIYAPERKEVKPS